MSGRSSEPFRECKFRVHWKRSFPEPRGDYSLLPNKEIRAFASLCVSESTRTYSVSQSMSEGFVVITITSFGNYFSGSSFWCATGDIWCHGIKSSLLSLLDSFPSFALIIRWFPKGKRSRDVTLVTVQCSTLK